MDREEEEADAAAKAFEGVRGEIALLRRAVERLAVERADVPDYAVTLGEISRDQRLAAERLDAIANSPSISLTPVAIGTQIERLSADLRRADQQTIDGARRELAEATKTITGRVSSARSRDRQSHWLVGSSLSGFLAGMLFLGILAGPIVRALPATWHQPENVAAWTMGASMWEAGSRLMAAASPERWNAAVIENRLFAKNESTIARCRNAARTKRKTVGCTIQVER